jgi:hypothetical protein
LLHWAKWFPVVVQPTDPGPEEEQKEVWAAYDAKHHHTAYGLMSDEEFIGEKGEPFSRQDALPIVVVNRDCPRPLLEAYMISRNTTHQNVWHISDVDIWYGASNAQTQCLLAKTGFAFTSWQKAMHPGVVRRRNEALKRIWEVIPHACFARPSSPWCTSLTLEGITSLSFCLV